MWPGNIFSCICLCVCRVRALTFKNFELETSFFGVRVVGYSFKISMSRSSTEVMGQGHGHVSVTKYTHLHVCLRLIGVSLQCVIFKIFRRRLKIRLLAKCLHRFCRSLLNSHLKDVTIILHRSYSWDCGMASRCDRKLDFLFTDRPAKALYVSVHFISFGLFRVRRPPPHSPWLL